MAKDVINSRFKDAVVPVPNAKSNDWGGNMGTPIEGAPPATKGELGEVQFVDIKDGAAGNKGFGPGKK
jgi:hypothetical protein